MSDSFNRLSKLWVKSDPTTNNNQYYLSSIEGTNWLKHIGVILQGSLKLIELLEKGYPVLVHCSDGWDRTSQLTALAQLLLDPYYRTIRGFQILVEKDWITIGHRFRERSDHLKKKL